MMYRNDNLRKAAKGAPCMRCRNAYVPVMWCHSNWTEHGKGAGLKAHDIFIAYLCQRCHDIIDNRIKELTPGERKEQWRTAHDATILYLFQSGIVSVRTIK